MTGPIVTTTFREEGAGDLSNAFDKVGQSSTSMADSVDKSGESMKNTSGGFDNMTERADTAETRFTGFYDTIGGTKDALAALSDESLSTSDKLIALGQAGADLAGGLVGFVIPMVQSLWTKLMGTTAAQWALTTAQTAWNAVTKASAAAMAILNAVIRANPFLFIVGLVLVLVGAFIALWNKSAAFRDFFIGIWNGIKNIVGSVVGFIVNVWNGIPGFFSRLVNGIKNVFSGIGNFIKNVFKGAINFVIDIINGAIGLINGLIGGYNAIPIAPDIPKIPKIPRLHSGGTVPGIPGQEVLTLLQGGEHVSTSSQGGTTQLVITGSGGLYDAVMSGLRTGDIYLVDSNGGRVRVA